MLAAVFVHPAWTLPPATLIALGLLWYWVRLGRPTVPPSRRRIRRWSLLIMLIGLGLLIWGLSFVDARVEPVKAVLIWSAATLMLLLVMAAAGIDALNNMRLHREAVQRDLHEAAVELAAALRERRNAPSSPESSDAENGGAR